MASARSFLAAALLVTGVTLGLVALPATLAADEGWIIDSFGSQIDIHPDGVVSVQETVAVDFQGLSRHGIFRDIPYRLDYDAAKIREYPIDLQSVTAPDGKRYPVTVASINSGTRRFRIGDPDRTVSGPQTYRIDYRIRQALNGFADHDELYWNVTGTWPVAMNHVSVTIGAPGPITRVECFQGPDRSKEPCDARIAAGRGIFSSTRPLPAGEQMTVVAAIEEGLVPAPEPRLLPKTSMSSLAGEGHPPWTITAMWVGLGLSVCGVLTLWWRFGRDRRYVALHHTGGDGQDERTPLFGARPIGVEFQPPDHIRPAQLGLLIDERADTLDVTATIVDLAVRGYLKITELPKHGWLGHTDWQLDLLKPADANLLEYERIVLDGLFETGPTRALSDLKNKFYKRLAEAKTALYSDAIERGWFPRNPASVRLASRLAGIGLIIGGILLAVYLENTVGLGPLAVPIAAGGLVLLAIGRLMPRRSAAGSDVLFRSLGFAKYIKTAEAESQAFAERANIFTEYLPYAIVFKCVDRWARAFKNIDLQVATAGWYVGQSGFNVGNFSSSLGTFSSSISQSLASTPGGSGSSGFGGGSGGGGGGGGGRQLVIDG